MRVQRGAKAPTTYHFPSSEEDQSHFSEGDPVVSKDGTYKGGLIALYWSPRTSYSFTLRNDRHTGEFAGSKESNTQLNTPAMSIKGSFTC